MKKISLFLLVLALGLGFVACNGDTTTEAETTAATTTAVVTTEDVDVTTATTTEEVLVPITEERVTNDTYTLLIQSSVMDGVFSPFFYSSAYDGDVVGFVNVNLLQMDATGAIVAGEEYPTVAQEYSIYYTDNLTTYAAKDSYEEGDYVVYEIVLKDGAKFSDGTVIDAEDVLFNYYTYLDPAYNGSSTLYTLPIVGLGDYRTQVVDSVTLAPTAEAILADNGRVTGYVANDDFTEVQFDAYWDAFEAAGTTFAGEIATYVMANYIAATNGDGDLYIDAYSSLGSGGAGLTPADVSASAAYQIAFGMDMWGYGAMSVDTLTFTGASGTVYTTADLTAAVYWAEILAANTDANGDIVGFADFQGLSDYESAGGDFISLATENFTSSYASVGSVPNISGLVAGTTMVGTVEHDTVKVILSTQNPKAILSLGVTVAPKHYYTAGYTAASGAIVNFGVEFDSDLFMAHLATFNGAPMGGGTYEFVNVGDDDTVYFVRNDEFESMGGVEVYNANIKNVALKIISSGAEYNSLEADDVHYATVSATADVMEDVALTDNLVAVLVDNLGYGYICVNPEVFNNINERLALTTVFDMSKVLEYYPNGLADLITRSSSQVSWAYPEGADYLYPFDDTLATTIAYYEAAGYTYDSTLGEFTDVPDVNFTLPSEAAEHPAGGVYLEAQTLLASIGVTAHIVVDTSLIANIKAGAVGVYALAWQSAADPDMYQVYHYLSQAESVQSNGIAWLYENGDDDTLGTIDVVKLDGSTVEMNQKEAIVYLAELIEEGVTYMLPEERAPIYAKALEVLAQLNIEIPTYQRKNLFIYNGDVIDQTSVSTTVTPYWGPLAEIWKVSFADGVEGNVTTDVVIGYE
jgi:peptide/nickel transport system substrate-binding protein